MNSSITHDNTCSLLQKNCHLKNYHSDTNIIFSVAVLMNQVSRGAQKKFPVLFLVLDPGLWIQPFLIPVKPRMLEVWLDSWYESWPVYIWTWTKGPQCNQKLPKVYMFDKSYSSLFKNLTQLSATISEEWDPQTAKGGDLIRYILNDHSNSPTALGAGGLR